MQNPSNSRYAATSWGGSPFTELTMPSGQLCLVRKLQPMDLANGQLLGSSDILAEIVNGQIEGAKSVGPRDHLKSKAVREEEVRTRVIESLSETVKSTGGMESMIDNVVIKAVVEPQIHPAPEEYSDRHEGVVYVDTVSFSDKMKIFNWVMGGLDQAKSFRGETADDVAALEDGGSVLNPSE